MEIYKRHFDNPLNKDGSKKENELLGDFEIIETLFEDSYSSQRLGVKDGCVFLISETEVSGFNGGSSFEAKELKSLKVK